MKIISLTMNAFLAYKDQTTVNFEDMIDHGLYLISGPTGAGKTTIFDAITFALYGVASGSERNQSYFRSDFASPSEETYVELTFELHQHTYTIKRSPSYTRPGYKSAKLANAYFTDKQETIEGVKEVNARINQLLGVDVHQFKQIVMIAQGEFTKLIYANSEEREKVLRHIFHSEPLVEFENKLREEAKAYKDQYLLSSQQLLSHYQLLTLPQDFMDQHQTSFHPCFLDEADVENQVISEQLDKHKEQYLIYQKQYADFSQSFYQKQKNNQDIKDYENINQQYQKLILTEKDMNILKKDIDKLKKIEQNQSMIDQYNKTYQESSDIKEEYSKLQLDYHQLEKQFQEIEKQFQDIPSLNLGKEKLLLEIEKTKLSLDKQKKYQSIMLQKEKYNQQYQELSQQHQSLIKKHNQFINRMERDQENVNNLPTLQLELQESEQLVKEMNQRRISIHELSDFFDDYTHVQDGHYGYTEKYKKATQDYLDILNHYHQEDENFKAQQAGILASSLQDNQPCPVCGSLHHPHSAKLSTVVLTSNELEELSQEVEKRKIDKEDVYQQVLIQNQHVQDIKTQMTFLKKQLNITEELSKEVFIHLLSEMTLTTKNQEKTYQKKHTEVEYLKKIKKSLQQDQLLSLQQQKQIEQQQKEIHSIEIQLNTCQTQLDELQGDNQLLSTSLENILNTKVQELEQLNQKINQISTNYHQYQQDLSVMKTQKQLVQKRSEELFLLLEELKKQYFDFINDIFQDEKNYFEYQKILETRNNKEQIYQNYLIQKETLSTRLLQLKEIVNGQELIDLSLEDEKLKILNNQKEESFKEMNSCEHIYIQNKTILEELKKEYLKNQDVFEKYTMYQDLYDTTSGKNTQRMSFERYVLSSYFEHILEYANVELLKMSTGRYALYRKQETKGAKQQGLDLSVLDYETGMMRDIQSLSGGESFKAALSLALGLSSMIQSYAGGIELNTLFIDEGFGSLDSESIDQALNVLLDLKNDNKVIGIISHVTELKERITTQIVVDKTKNGSCLHVEKE